MSKEVRRLHDHPSLSPVVILHVKGEGSITPENPSHAFGPFDSELEATVWSQTEQDCDCIKVMVDLIDPNELRGT